MCPNLSQTYFQKTSAENVYFEKARVVKIFGWLKKINCSEYHFQREFSETGDYITGCEVCVLSEGDDWKKGWEIVVDRMMIEKANFFLKFSHNDFN